jgi:hypothetical protein
MFGTKHPSRVLDALLHLGFWSSNLSSEPVTSLALPGRSALSDSVRKHKSHSTTSQHRLWSNPIHFNIILASLLSLQCPQRGTSLAPATRPTHCHVHYNSSRQADPKRVCRSYTTLRMTAFGVLAIIGQRSKTLRTVDVSVLR